MAKMKWCRRTINTAVRYATATPEMNRAVHASSASSKHFHETIGILDRKIVSVAVGFSGVDSAPSGRSYNF